MKKLVSLFFLSLIIVLSISDVALAEYVRGYYRKNGSYVSGYNRSNSNSTVADNYSFKGNINPYTGATGTNYYRSSPSSSYFGTSPSQGWRNSGVRSWGSPATGVLDSPSTGAWSSPSTGIGGDD